MKFFSTMLLLCMSIAVQSQTCIIIYVSNNGIIAGADRKYHQAGAGSNHKIYYGKKIFVKAGCAWAFSGADYYDSIHTICKRVCIESSSLSGMVKRFVTSLQHKSINATMHQLFLASNKEQKSKYKKNLAEIAFFKFEGKAYKAYRVTVSMPGVFKKDERLAFETDSIVSTKNTVGIFVMGHYESFPADAHPEKWMNPPAVIRSLIKKQSKFTPDDVSPWSDILKISGKRINWQ